MQKVREHYRWIGIEEWDIHKEFHGFHHCTFITLSFTFEFHFTKNLVLQELNLRLKAHEAPALPLR